jgi:hypothetical protein
MEDNTDKKVTFQKSFGSRRKGRPNSRRVNDIEVDLKTGREWVEKAANGRMCWRRPRPEESCSATDDDDDDGLHSCKLFLRTNNFVLVPFFCRS